MYGESSLETYIFICEIDSPWEFAACLRELTMGLCNNLEGGTGRKVEGGSRGRGHIYLRLIHVIVWQKPTQNCKQLSFN